jgi:hypothetical protein
MTTKFEIRSNRLNLIYLTISPLLIGFGLVWFSWLIASLIRNMIICDDVGFRLKQWSSPENLTWERINSIKITNKDVSWRKNWNVFKILIELIAREKVVATKIQFMANLSQDYEKNFEFDSLPLSTIQSFMDFVTETKKVIPTHTEHSSKNTIEDSWIFTFN